MFVRSFARGFSALCVAVALVGCGNPSGLDSIQVTPASESMTVGQTVQLTATGTYGNAKHPSTQNVTTAVTWSSTAPSVATVSNSGLVTAVAPGSTTIVASATAFNGPVSSSASFTVTGGTSGGSLLSLTIIPGSIAVGNLLDTGQFLAIGTYSVSPFVRDLTNSPNLTWISSQPNVFPVNTNTAGNVGATAGIATAHGNGNATITAEARDTVDGTIQTATTTFSCCTGDLVSPLLATLTVYNEGLNTDSWRVTAPSASGTPDVLDCGPGAPGGKSVCTATYPFSQDLANPTKITLTATGAAFGGWSYNCLISDAQGNPLPNPVINAAGPNYCTVTFTNSASSSASNPNVTVGAIFN